MPISLTVVLDAYSIAYPTILNRIKAWVSPSDDPLVETAAIINDAPHPERIWHFPGLPRRNYTFQMWEIDGSDNLLNRLAYFDVVPDQVKDLLTRDDEQITEGVTPDFYANITEYYFDGRETAPGSGIFHPDYRGWNINPERRNGGGTMFRDSEYSWDAITGKFMWLVPGDGVQDQETYNIDFDPLEESATGSVAIPGFAIRLITVDDNITLADFGNMILVEPASTKLTLTLPDVGTISEGLPLKIKVNKGAHCSVVLQTDDFVKFNQGKQLIMCDDESIELLKYNRGGIGEWHVLSPDGNFKTVGKIVDFDQLDADIVNVLPMDGSSVSVNTYWRLYNYVLSLPAIQKPSYIDWVNNKTQFSLDDGLGNFHVPDRRTYYGRNTGTGMTVAGAFQRCAIEKHKHIVADMDNPAAIGGAPFGSCGFTNKRGNAGSDSDNDYWFTNDGSELAGAAQLNAAGVIGTETRPNSYTINQYVLI